MIYLLRAIAFCAFYGILTFNCPLFSPVALSQEQRPEKRPEQRGAREDTPAKFTDDKEPIFSGPQTGEPLPELPVWELSAKDEPSKKVDLSKLNADSPIAVLFLQEKSRPAFQLARIMSTFLEQKKESKLQFYIVVLTDDRSSSEKWLGQIRHYMSEQTHFAVADGGLEGPGALGLNRLVALTVLIAKEQKVTANFALTQVTAAIDGPPILKAMNELAGGGEIPDIDDLMPQPKIRQPAR
jgi:hypothetical protein